mmetsp:Transcript_5306/g.11510  ORF Transcript_5306/g.11510 Transcript_5306/m.11510 type:complete len:716 (-) Transcript_5306:249-2396(-)
MNFFFPIIVPFLLGAKTATIAQAYNYNINNDDHSVILAQPSPGNTILLEKYSSNNHKNPASMSIPIEEAVPDVLFVNSNVPVTIQRYTDGNENFNHNEEPFKSNEIKVLVTSNCDSHETSAVPTITFLDSNSNKESTDASSKTKTISNSFLTSVNVMVQGYMPTSATAALQFLEASSYHVMWTYRYYMGGRRRTLSSSSSSTSSSSSHRNALTCQEPAGFPPRESSSSRKLSSVFSIMMALLLPNNHNKNIGVLANNINGNQDGGRDDIGGSSRGLKGEQCIFNAEILLDGCHRSVNVTAPSIRVINASIINRKSDLVQDEDNPFRCNMENEADLIFGTNPIVLSANDSLRVPTFKEDARGEWYKCYRPVPGRPFVDSSGRASLLASPLNYISSPSSYWQTINNEKEVFSGDGRPIPDSSCNSQFDPNNNNNTSNDGNNNTTSFTSLGQKWTQNALGEHASIASFAAFSIALMTNGAPLHLVEDSLSAAMDEVCHARASFEIATKLTGGGGHGRVVAPGPLPESQHVFFRNLEMLAMSTGREGCIDETLSALEAAAEVDHINALLEAKNGVEDGTRYSNVDNDTLIWIRNELRTIALEEGNHSALAWRTLRWVCSVDSEACDSVRERVFETSALEEAFRRRFGSSFLDDGSPQHTRDGMWAGWMKITSWGMADPEQQLVTPPSLCSNQEGKTGNKTNASSLVSTVVDNILCAMLG